MQIPEKLRRRGIHQDCEGKEWDIPGVDLPKKQPRPKAFYFRAPNAGAANFEQPRT